MSRHPLTAVVHGPDDDRPIPQPPPEPPKGHAPHAVSLRGHLADPGPIVDCLRRTGARVGYDPDLGLYLLHRHDNVDRALRDSGTYSNALTLAPIYEPCAEALRLFEKLDVPPTTAAADDPTHKRTRIALKAIFPQKPDVVREQWASIVAWRVDAMVAELCARSGQTVDLVGPCGDLPLAVVTAILGVPAEDAAQIKAWADGQIALVWGLPDDAEQVRLAQGLLDFWEYTRDLVRHRFLTERPDHQGDVISRALAYRRQSDRILTLDEVASLAFNLLVAGHETTAGLLAHCIHRALVAGVWASLADPNKAAAWVEETLRVQPPIGGWLRLAKRDVSYGGQTIPAGARVLLLIGAANTDSGGHLSFGRGAHYCVGADLARLEAATAVSRLATAMPGMRLVKAGASKPNVAFRAHTELLVAV